jgi:GNAT superfamily N-acetyltransferase
MKEYGDEDMEIKELKKENIEKLVDFFATYALSEPEKEQGRMMFENDIRSAFETNHMLVAQDGEELVGFLWAHIHDNLKGKKVDIVKMLLISPEKIGEGIGGALLEKEREYAKEKDVDIIDIDIGR